MCNLYTIRKSEAEVAKHFGVEPSSVPLNVPDDILPAYPGIVVREAEGKRILQSMVWGFPLRPKGMKPESKPKAVNNIADLTKSMWIGLARKPQSRCLIPLTEFAEPEGAKGSKTRTWVTIAGQSIVAWGGLWRPSAEWGPVYSGAMADCNEAMRPLHDRMPVLLHPHEYDQWLHGSLEDLVAFQKRSFPDELIEMNRTNELWVKKKAPAAA